ncbi:MAG: hypothetical protein FRX48_04732 [Lasallia pustulata]|uniref:Uncharacterized protein n=1 Tax=Lasallia pustulata TaxID=136370 RepID=A0A5M8PQY1_9LECA|nr:MAG: hypothetical protein FRX48_04732 [Lasallia pustulata]
MESKSQPVEVYGVHMAAELPAKMSLQNSRIRHEQSTLRFHLAPPEHGRTAEWRCALPLVVAPEHRLRSFASNMSRFASTESSGIGRACKTVDSIHFPFIMGTYRSANRWLAAVNLHQDHKPIGLLFKPRPYTLSNSLGGPPSPRLLSPYHRLQRIPSCIQPPPLSSSQQSNSISSSRAGLALLFLSSSQLGPVSPTTHRPLDTSNFHQPIDLRTPRNPKPFPASTTQTNKHTMEETLSPLAVAPPTTETPPPPPTSPIPPHQSFHLRPPLAHSAAPQPAP